MVDRNKLLARLSRRAALRAGTAAGTAALLGAAAQGTEAEYPNPGSPFSELPVGGPVTLTFEDGIDGVGVTLSSVLRGRKGFPRPRDSTGIPAVFEYLDNVLLARLEAMGAGPQGAGQDRMTRTILTTAVAQASGSLHVQFLLRRYKDDPGMRSRDNIISVRMTAGPDDPTLRAVSVTLA